jgi:hypothetical protein
MENDLEKCKIIIKNLSQHVLKMIISFITIIREWIYQH